MIGKEKVELIKQLLSLSKSKVNAHEAQVAALKAQKIMARRYNICFTWIFRFIPPLFKKE